MGCADMVAAAGCFTAISLQSILVVRLAAYQEMKTLFLLESAIRKYKNSENFRMSHWYFVFLPHPKLRMNTP